MKVTVLAESSVSFLFPPDSLHSAAVCRHVSVRITTFSPIQLFIVVYEYNSCVSFCCLLSFSINKAFLSILLCESHWRPLVHSFVVRVLLLRIFWKIPKINKIIKLSFSSNQPHNLIFLNFILTGVLFMGENPKAGKST